jgi:CheY-specific phosphatase CheX
MPSTSPTSAALCEALVKVAETSFFAFAEAAGDDAVPTAERWYAATVRFNGPLSGAITVAVPTPLAYDLAQAFLGGAEVDEPTVRDLCGEFANQVTGTWLTGLQQRVRFDLEVPAVEEVDAAPAGGVLMMINDQPAVVVLAVSKE